MIKMVSIPIGFSSSLQHAAYSTANSYRWVVSIPIGFSSSLQLIMPMIALSEVGRVSIPIGFSSSLQRPRSASGPGWRSSFQSLSGFQVRCNFFMQSRLYPAKQVSIPIGFSSSLQPNLGGGSDSTYICVSIPIGFSSSLQLQYRRLHHS